MNKSYKIIVITSISQIFDSSNNNSEQFRVPDVLLHISRVTKLNLLAQTADISGRYMAGCESLNNVFG